MSRALEGLRKYQEAPRRPPPEPMPVVAERRGSVLRDFGGTGAPVLFVPSLINPPSILDLSHGRSLLRWLAARGHHVLLLDWGWDLTERRDMSIADHVTDIAVPLISQLDQPPALVGYCLGGTMAIAAASLAEVRSVATIAAPWHFSGFSDDARAMLAELWSGAQPAVEALDLLPMEVLQSAFWMLDPARTTAKFEAFAERGGDEAEAFVTLEDWANDGPPLTQAAARELFESFFEHDIPGRGEWMVEGRNISPDRLTCPLLNIISTVDRIVPRESAIRTGERIELSRGHVGMVVGSQAREALWEPLDAWLSRPGASC